MAIIDLGISFNLEGSDTTTTEFTIPDTGSFPEYKHPFGQNGCYSDYEFGSEYGLGRHRWIRVSLADYYSGHVWLMLLFAASRQEWVCLWGNNHADIFNGSPETLYLGGGPYAVTPQLMAVVLGAYEAHEELVPTPELIRCHPDFFLGMR